MRVLIVITLALTAFVSIGFAQSKSTILAGGCATEYYLLHDLVSEFNTGDITINVLKTGNMKGFKMFAEGKSDFAFLSTPHTNLADNMKMSPDKIAKMKSIEIAQEPILVVVNPATKIKKLTKNQVIAIYNGEITNWKQVGGANLDIIPAALNEQAESGLWAAFKKMTIGMENNFKGKLVDLKEPSATKHFLRNTAGGITYIGYASFNESMGDALSLDGVDASLENFQNGSYPFVAKYYLTYKEDNMKDIQPFIDFIRSPKGKNIINSKMMATD